MRSTTFSFIFAWIVVVGLLLLPFGVLAYTTPTGGHLDILLSLGAATVICWPAAYVLSNVIRDAAARVEKKRSSGVEAPRSIWPSITVVRIISVGLALLPFGVVAYAGYTGDCLGVLLLGLGTLLICFPAAFLLSYGGRELAARIDERRLSGVEAPPSVWPSPEASQRREKYQDQVRKEAWERRKAKRPGYETRLAEELAGEREWHKLQSVLARVGSFAAFQYSILLGIWFVAKSPTQAPPSGLLILASIAFTFSLLMFVVLFRQSENAARRTWPRNDRS